MGRAKRKIKVMLAELAKQMVVKEIENGTKLGDFLTQNGLAYGSAIMVNGKEVSVNFKLKEGDIISAIGKVSGGE